MRILPIVILLLLLPLTVVAGSLEGRLAYRKGDYTTALREFGSEAQAGPLGKFFLGLMYLRGEGLPRDEARGVALLKISADEGYSAAQYLLGCRYFYGVGLPRDEGRARIYLQRAATDKDYRAVELLKIVAKGSQGERKDRSRVVEIVKRKARSKVADAQYTLAFMYLIGDGVPKDGVEEVRWYRAAAADNARAAFMLSLMYQFGEGVPVNLAESFRLMRIAAEKGDVRAQYYLGTFYYQGYGTQVDHVSAGAWFKKTAENGLTDGQLAYGMLLLSGDGVALDKAQAVEWLAKAAKQDNAGAREVLRELLTYRGQTAASPLNDAALSPLLPAKPHENQLRLEGKGVILDQGRFGLKFSLPNLYDAYAPQNRTAVQSLWEQLQGGTFDIIIRQAK